MADVKLFFKRHFVPDWSIIPSSLKYKEDEGHPRTVNIFLGFFFMFNYMVGTGLLGVPFAFFHGGFIAGLLTMLVVGFLSWICSLYVIESMARAQALTDHQELIKSYINGSSTAGKEALSKEEPNFHISLSRKFEPSEICEVFVGRWLKVVFLLLLVIHSFFAALSNSIVTAAAWSVNLPLNFGTLEECTDKDFLHQLLPGDGCLNAYRFSLLLFAFIVVPLSLLDLKEQAVIQFLFGVFRLIAIGAIIMYCLVYLVQGYMVLDCHDPVPTLRNTSIEWPGNITSTMEMLVHFDFKGWVVAVPVFVYAVALQQGIATLTHPIKQKDWLRGLFNTLFAITIPLYILLGVVVAFWFRDCTNETCTLNWNPLKGPNHPTTVRALSYYIILFPSVDIVSAFPLGTHTVVNNIYTVVFGRDTSQVKGWKHCFIQLGLKFVVSILPIAVALFVSNLVYILKYAALSGFFIFYFGPIVFQLTSQWVSYNTFNYMVDSDSEQVGYPMEKKDIQLKSVKDTEEEETLLPEETEHSKTTAKTVFEFFFTRKNTSLYKTPYSTVLGHPLGVLFVLLLVITCFILTVISLFVHPT